MLGARKKKVEKDALSFETSNHQHRKVFNPRLSQKVAVRRWHCALSLERTDAGKISLKTLKVLIKTEQEDRYFCFLQFYLLEYQIC